MPNVPHADIRNDVVDLIPELRRFARRFCKDVSGVDDLVQETLLKALSAADSFSPGTRLKSWLFTIMRHHYCTFYNKQKRVVLGLDSGDGWMAPALPTQEWSQRGQELQKAIAGLSGDHRDVIELVLIQGRSYDDVARIQGCAVGTIKSRVFRARENLAHAMGDITSEAMNI